MKREVQVVRVSAIDTPKTDALGLTEIDGYTVVVRLADWHERDVRVHIEVGREPQPQASRREARRALRPGRPRGVGNGFFDTIG